MNTIVGQQHILFITLDCLRFDVAEQALQQGRLPNLSQYLGQGWQRRHSPGNFTYAAHHAFFAGFLPTPDNPGRHARLFASQFAGSLTTAEETFVFEQANLVEGLQAKGYLTICIGGVGFFNQANALSRSLTDLFEESYWQADFAVNNVDSTQNQIEFAIERLDQIKEQKIFLFINISAIHQPNYFYLPGQTKADGDCLASHKAALCYVDSQLPRLFQTLQKKGPTFCILCSDHGEAYGEDGYYGHRLNHEVVLTVPYAQFTL